MSRYRQVEVDTSRASTFTGWPQGGESEVEDVAAWLRDIGADEEGGEAGEEGERSGSTSLVGHAEGLSASPADDGVSDTGFSTGIGSDSREDHTLWSGEPNNEEGASLQPSSDDAEEAVHGSGELEEGAS